MALSLVPPLPSAVTTAARLSAGGAGGTAFSGVLAAAADAPLHEVAPAAAGDGAAALGFALGLTSLWRAAPLIAWIAPEHSLHEDGALSGAGAAQYGLLLEDLIAVRTRTQADALWAAEETLCVPGAIAVCTIGAGKKPLDLTASRRLLLAAERHGSHCLLLRMDVLTPSAAWTRWRIAPAPSRAAARELGAPAFAAALTRQRAGRAGLSWILEWNAHERAFSERRGRPAALDFDLVQAAGDGPAAARGGRAH